MIEYVALGAASVAAFGLLGIGLAVFQLSAVLRDGLGEMREGIAEIGVGIIESADSLSTALSEVAESFSWDEDGEDEEDPPMDDEGFDIDDDTVQAFVEIAESLSKLERRTAKIVREEFE